MSLYDTDYNSGSANNNDSDSEDDYEERENLKLAKYAIISFEVSRLGEYSGDYGQNLIVDLDDVDVLDGIVMDRNPGTDDDTNKVFGWETWFQTDENGQLAEEVGENDVPTRHAESFGSNDYNYELTNSVKEDEEETHNLGNLTIWMGNQTKFRTFAKVLTPQGHDIVDDKEDDFNWLATDDPQIRGDLQGQRMTMFFQEETFTPDGEDEPVTYTDAVVLDADTGAGITIKNGSSSGGSSSSSSSSSSGDSGSLGGNSGLPEGVPDGADEIIGFLARTDKTDPDAVADFIEGEVDTDYDIDACIAEIEGRQ